MCECVRGRGLLPFVSCFDRVFFLLASRQERAPLCCVSRLGAPTGQLPRAFSSQMCRRLRKPSTPRTLSLGTQLLEEKETTRERKKEKERNLFLVLFFLALFSPFAMSLFFVAQKLTRKDRGSSGLARTASLTAASTCCSRQKGVIS